MIVDSEGFLWVKEWSGSETGLPDQWSVFSPQGRWLGVVAGHPDPWLCTAMSPCWIDSEFMIVQRFSAIGVETIEGHRIRK